MSDGARTLCQREGTGDGAVAPSADAASADWAADCAAARMVAVRESRAMSFDRPSDGSDIRSANPQRDQPRADQAQHAGTQPEQSQPDQPQHDGAPRDGTQRPGGQHDGNPRDKTGRGEPPSAGQARPEAPRPEGMPGEQPRELWRADQATWYGIARYRTWNEWLADGGRIQADGSSPGSPAPDNAAADGLGAGTIRPDKPVLDRFSPAEATHYGPTGNRPANDPERDSPPTERGTAGDQSVNPGSPDSDRSPPDNPGTSPDRARQSDQMAELEQRFAAKLDAMQSALEAKYAVKLDEVRADLDAVREENANLRAELGVKVGEMHADVDSAKAATQVVGEKVLGEVRKLDARVSWNEEQVADQQRAARQQEPGGGDAGQSGALGRVNPAEGMNTEEVERHHKHPSWGSDARLAMYGAGAQAGPAIAQAAAQHDFLSVSVAVGTVVAAIAATASAVRQHRKEHRGDIANPPGR